jgi:hypothetical protein
LSYCTIYYWSYPNIFLNTFTLLFLVAAATITNYLVSIFSCSCKFPVMRHSVLVILWFLTRKLRVNYLNSTTLYYSVIPTVVLSIMCLINTLLIALVPPIICTPYFRALHYCTQCPLSAYSNHISFHISFFF